MASPGVNFAITADGEPYNKLQRPKGYLIPTAPRLPPLAAAVPPTTHASKRKCGHDAAPRNKRMRAERGGDMRTMLPGLDDEEQLSDSSTSEALAYLRDVRFEASTIPQVLVAPTVDEHNVEVDGHLPYISTSDNQQLVYEDGIWIAIDGGYEATYDEDEGDYCNLDPQESCYKLLLTRFQSLRHRIAEADASNTARTVGVTFEDSSGKQPPTNKRAWLQTIDRDFPTIDQVFQMDEQTLFFGLQSCASSLAQSSTISHQKCCWIWTLLASTGDIGTLDHERISRVRDLGLQAGRLGARLGKGINRRQRHGDGNADAEDMQSKQGKLRCNDGKDAAGVSEDAKRSKVAEMPQEDETAETGKEDYVSSELADDERHGGFLDRETSESDAEMSISDRKDQVHVDAEPKDLEQARARLLAQLGDRLVQSQVPLSRAEAERQPRQMRSRGPHQRTLHQATPASADMKESYDMHAGGATVADSDWNTRVAVDMILTVVAECYGQRDLLEFREAW